MVNLCAEMGVMKIKLELERLYSDRILSDCMKDTVLTEKDISMRNEGRKREYSLETLKGKLRECQNRGQKEGIYISIDPPYLMDEFDSCFLGNLRRGRRCICQRSFSVATIAPNGDILNCILIRKAFGNILHMPLSEIWNTESAGIFRRYLIDNNLTPLCENCPWLMAGDHRR
jgi:radical SAM protein with 4Fe4S-binding SPASM domain